MLFRKPSARLIASISLLLGLGTTSSAHKLRAATPTNSHEFRIQQHWDIGGTGGWGFLAIDTATHQLYIPRTNRVTVVDTETGKVFGEVEGMTNIRDIVLDDSGKYGYVTDPTDGSAGLVRVFDRSTLKLVISIPTL
jgi:DNA-binding beta-propeller fold protein YncE